MKTYLTLSVALIFSVITSFSQELTSDRKYYNLQQCEKEIFQLPFDFEHIKNVLYPEIISQRDILAPHYPDVTTLPRNEEAVKMAFHSWIDVYETEYNSYYTYLATFIRQHKN